MLSHTCLSSDTLGTNVNLRGWLYGKRCCGWWWPNSLVVWMERSWATRDLGVAVLWQWRLSDHSVEVWFGGDGHVNRGASMMRGWDFGRKLCTSALAMVMSVGVMSLLAASLWPPSPRKVFLATLQQERIILLLHNQWIFTLYREPKSKLHRTGGGDIQENKGAP